LSQGVVDGFARQTFRRDLCLPAFEQSFDLVEDRRYVLWEDANKTTLTLLNVPA
jgi:hypothetical protein